MKKYILKNHINNLEIFAGYYNNFIECLEDAVNQNISLIYINLKNANLSNANLDGANMSGALLSGANLTGANLSEANLQNSIFYNCSLYNTCFSYSNLQGSDFRAANFGATLIEGSDLQECIFSTLSCFDLDFYFAKNMEGSLFYSPNGALYDMSKTPIILKGLLNTHIIILDNTIKIGTEFFPKTLLPNLMKTIYDNALMPTANSNIVDHNTIEDIKTIP